MFSPADSPPISASHVLLTSRGLSFASQIPGRSDDFPCLPLPGQLHNYFNTSLASHHPGTDWVAPVTSVDGRDTHEHT